MKNDAKDKKMSIHHIFIIIMNFLMVWLRYKKKMFNFLLQ